MVDAGTILIVPKNYGCNAHCKFCISSAIQHAELEPIIEKEICIKKLESAIKFARQMRIYDANITGGSEPTLEKAGLLEQITHLLSDYFGRVNMYTNGAKLLDAVESSTLIENLAESGLTNITISRAHYDDYKNSDIMGLGQYSLEQIAQTAEKNDIDLKLSCLLAKDYIDNEEKVIDYIKHAKEKGIKKVIFRELLCLNDSNKGSWAKEHYVPVELVKKTMKENNVLQLTGVWNQLIWDYEGVAVTVWPDNSRKDTINNGDLIYMPDNHLYSSWVSRASRIM